MEKEKLGSEPAFPPTREMQELAPACEGYHVGMSKRFYAACMAMQGLLSNQTFMSQMASDYKEDLDRHIVENVYEIVDELLKQENNTSTDE